MIKEIRNNKSAIFHWFLALTGITLVFPDYSLSSKAILALGLFWLFIYSDLNEKKRMFAKNYKKLLAVGIFYVLSLIGLTYTDNLHNGLEFVNIRFPLLLLPIIIFGSRLDKDSFLFTWKYFSYATLAISILALIKALYFGLNHLGDYLFYDRFSVLTNKHATYFALFIIISILFFFYQIIEQKRRYVLSVLGIIFLIYILEIVSNRISFIALAVSLSLVFLFKVKNVKSKIF